MGFTDDLIDWAHGEPGALQASQRARQIIQLSAIDWAACGIAGATEGTFDTWVHAYENGGQTPAFSGTKTGAAEAALVNGTLSHALDFDDTHFDHIGHPSVVIFPAIMAADPKDWPSFEDAAIVGIEASIRIGIYFGRGHYQSGFHQTATAGAFGACLAVASLLKLSPERMHAALGLCASMASGLKAQFGTMGKPLNAGLAARAGFEAASWAARGMTGATAGLEAFATAFGAAKDDHALAGLGVEWRVERLSHKFHACCHGLHASLEALRGWSGGRIETLEIFTHPRWLSVCNIAAPQTGLEAKFSYKQVAAMALSGIETGSIEAYTDAVTQDAKITDLRGRICVTGDETLSEMQARLIVTGPGEMIELTHDLASPVALRDLSVRLREKAVGLAGEERGRALWASMRRQDLAGFRAAAFGG